MKTVFILGAGASKNFGFPLGLELKDILLKNLEPHIPLYQHLVLTNGIPKVADFAKSLFRAERPTIDDFLRARWNTEHIRKVGSEALVTLLCSCEKHDNLFHRSELGWYSLLLNYLRNNKSKILSCDFGFITFNYDRSLEHYLYEAFRGGDEDIPESAVKNFLGPNNLLHVHGQLGQLSWQHDGGEGIVHDYDYNLSPTDTIEIARRHILLPHQDFLIDERINTLLSEASCIVFLGFGFHTPNMKRIGFEKICKKAGVKVFATIKNLTNLSRIDELESAGVRALDMDCRLFVTEFLKRIDSEELDKWGLKTTKQLADIIRKTE